MTTAEAASRTTVDRSYLADLERYRATAKERYDTTLTAFRAAQDELRRMDGLLRDELEHLAKQEAEAQGGPVQQ